MRIVPPRVPLLLALSTKDLVALMFIVSAGITQLRFQQPGVPDIDALRAELRRREFDLETAA